jgi:hypothetical protein
MDHTSYVGAIRVTTSVDLASGMITAVRREIRKPCRDTRCLSIRARWARHGAGYQPCYTQPRETGHAYD